ncbi:hypothetical protein U1Q18_046603 [Sarracenia purpurea var. burkii]
MGEENHEVSDEENVYFELRAAECEKALVDEKIKILRDKKAHIATKCVGSEQKAHIAETGDTHPNIRPDISSGGGRSGFGNHGGRFGGKGGRLSANTGIWREKTALNNMSITKEDTAHQVFEKTAKPRNWAGLLNPIQQEADQHTWTTVKKGKSVSKFVPGSVKNSDIPSTSMGPREATEEPTPLISEPLRKEKDNAARPPSPGNQFALLDEDTDTQGENETDLPYSILADMDKPMADSECEHAQATPTQKAQLSNQSQSKQNNKKSSSSRKQKHRSFT